MSLWKIGADDVSQETQQFKDKLASKDGQIASQQTQIMKQDRELEDLRTCLNEALQKLARESDRILELQKDLSQCKGDLRNERDTRSNVESSLETAKNKIKAKETETHELEAVLDRLSGNSNEDNNRSRKLEEEKISLESRVRELEANLRLLQSTAAAPSHRRPSRSSSSQFYDLRIKNLEKDLQELRDTLDGKDTEIIRLQEKLAHTQSDLLRVDNERLAQENKYKAQNGELQSLLREKGEELEFYRERQTDGGREEELLQRIEEDEAKIAALETMIRQSGDVKGTKEKLRSMEKRVKAEIEKMELLESQNVDLVRENEQLLNELESTQGQTRDLEHQLEEKQDQIDNMMKERSHLISVLDDPEAGLSKQSTDSQHATPATDGVQYKFVERLLNAVDRLRGERDELRRRLEFLETEHRFTVEALEKRLNATPAHDKHLMREQAPIHSSPGALTQSSHKAIRRATKTVAILVTLFLHSQSRLEECVERERYQRDCSVADVEKYTSLEREVDRMAHQLEQSKEQEKDLERQLMEVANERDDVVSRLTSHEEEMKISQKDLRDHLEELDAHLNKVSRTLELVESERDSLSLQVANLTTDLQIAQRELTSAESRYSSLQTHQLSTMSSSKVVQALREQIEELEGRVVRRNEQIGIHQHDISRMETNLKLQEERLGELMAELGTLATQKEAMLEDCADARDARDDALARVETLEEEMESLESKLSGSENAVNSLIVLLTQARFRIKSLDHQSHSRITHLRDQLRDSQATRHTLEVNLIELRGSTTEDTRQMIVALAHSQLRLGTVIALVRSLNTGKDGLLHDLALADKQFREQETIIRRLEEECDTLRSGSSTSVAELASRSSEYQAEIDKLKEVISEVKAETRLADLQLADSSTKLQKVQQENVDLAAELEKAKLDFIQIQEAEMHSRKELTAAVTIFNEERADWIVRENEHAEVLSRAQLQITELEERAEALDQEVSRLEVGQAEVHMEKEKALRESDHIRGELEALIKERDTLALSARSEFDQRQSELNSHKSELESRVTTLTCLAEDRTQEIGRLQKDLEVANQCLAESKNKYTAEIESLAREREDAQSSLAALRQDVEELQDVVQRNGALIVKNEEESERLQQHITTLEAQVQKSQSYINALERQIRDKELDLGKVEADLKATQVKLTRSETAAKAAEVQISLESVQFKRELAELQGKLKTLQPSHELEDALSNLKERNEEMEELLKAKCIEIEENDDRALEMMKENKKLSSKLEALTRKAQNLQMKLTTAKAAIANSNASQGTRKPSPEPIVQPSSELGAQPPPKLSSRRPEQTADAQSQNSRRRSSRLSTGDVLPVPTEKHLGAKSSSSRVVSETNSQNRRPKTPERRSAPTTVFKARTPEQLRAQDRNLDRPTSVVGIKRRAPDDFEACEPVPPQGFTADSIPCRDNDSVTPRVRKMFGNLQSGFTPVRNKVLSSPKRQTAAIISTPLIQDVTNSPRSSVPFDSAAKQKRSWLGKIRGTTTSQAVVNSATRRVHAPRGERSNE